MNKEIPFFQLKIGAFKKSGDISKIPAKFQENS